MDAPPEPLRPASRIARKAASRRELIQRATALGFGASALSAGSGASREIRQAAATTTRSVLADDAGVGVRGGVLRVAFVAEPNTLDLHRTTARIASTIG